MKHKPDLSEQRAPLSEGIKVAHIVNVEQKTSANGNQYLNWTLLVYPDKNFAWAITMLGGPGAGKLIHLLKCVNVELDKDGAFDDQDVLGKPVQLKLVVLNKQDKNGHTKSVYDIVDLSPVSDQQRNHYGVMTPQTLQQFKRKDEDMPF